MNARHGIAAGLAWLAVALPAQQPAADPAALVAALGADPDDEAAAVAAERALRALCRMPGRPPLEALRDAARREASHRAAVLVLSWHGALRVEDAWVGDRADPELAPHVLAPLDEAGLRAVLHDQDAAPTARRAALFALQDRGRLSVDDAVTELGGEPELVHAVCAVLRWEWPELPPELLRQVRARAQPRWSLLQALADAPRPQAHAWALGIARDQDLPVPDRLLAMGAMAEPADRELALLALRSLPLDDLPPVAFRAAVERIPAEVADRMVGEVHRLCERGLDAARVLPFLERLSPKGAEQLLGLAAALDPRTREVLTAFLAQTGSPGYRERVRAALDGGIPLEPHLLPRGAAMLDRPARVQRVLAVLGDSSQPAQAREYAFSALLAARVDVPELLAFVRQDDTGERAIQYLQACPGPLPEELVRDALLPRVGDEARRRRQFDRLQQAAYSALERVGVPPGLESELLELCAGDPESRDGARLRERVAAARALAMGGSEAAGHRLWRAVRDRPGLRDDVLEWSAIGRRPWAHALLLGVLHDSKGGAPEDRELRGRLRALLIELGDRRELRELLADAPGMQARWLRRARAAAPDLGGEAALGLLALLPRAADPDTAAEMVLWAGGSDDPAVQDALLALWREAGDSELREASLRGLMRGRHRATLLLELDRALAAGALDARAEQVAYEALATLPQPPDAGELRAIARLFLLLPLRAPDEELARALRFPGGRAGFPMAQAIAQGLRRNPGAAFAPALAEAGRQAAADPAVAFLARQRLTALWHGASVVPAVQREVGIATAALLLAIPDPRGPGAGAAWFFLGEDAEGRAAFAEAAQHFRKAARALLRGGADALAARTILGERDPQAGTDPFAALAARPWLCEARAALQLGDQPTARDRLRVALELGHPDAGTRARAGALMEQTR